MNRNFSITPFPNNIGFRIQFFRKKIGLSQEELAERSGLSYSTISHIESTTSYPLSMLALYRIAKVLEVDSAISDEQL